MIVGHQYLTIPNNPIPIELIDITRSKLDFD